MFTASQQSGQTFLCSVLFRFGSFSPTEEASGSWLYGRKKFSQSNHKFIRLVTEITPRWVRSDCFVLEIEFKPSGRRIQAELSRHRRDGLELSMTKETEPSRSKNKSRLQIVQNKSLQHQKTSRDDTNRRTMTGDESKPQIVSSR